MRRVLEAIAVSLVFWLLLEPLRSFAISQGVIQAGTALHDLGQVAIGMVLPALSGWLSGIGVKKWNLEARLGIRPTTPRAWDFRFGLDECVYVIITLTDGSKLGGYWGSNSYASEHPASEDLYIEAVHRLTGEHHFGEEVPHTKGAWIPGKSILFIEFFTPGAEPHVRPETRAAGQPER